MRICSRAAAELCIVTSERFCWISSPRLRRPNQNCAHHFTQVALTEAAIEWWWKAGQRSPERSALIEAAEL
jgi:hypothetical protein